MSKKRRFLIITIEENPLKNEIMSMLISLMERFISFRNESTIIVEVTSDNSAHSFEFYKEKIKVMLTNFKEFHNLLGNIYPENIKYDGTIKCSIATFTGDFDNKELIEG